MTHAIRAENLFKTYPGKPPVEAVRGIHLEVPAGECFGLLGPNGAGKTTTMEMIEGLLDPTSGTIEVFGLNWRNSEMQIRALIGISLQETRLTDKLTVRETVRLFRSFYPEGLDPDEAIEQVSLQEKARSFVEKLSGGQRQRLAVACALVGNPKILFLDEPTTGLDPQSRRQLWDVIREFKSRGGTVMLTTHYMDEAERLCERVAIVDHGTIIALGSPKELILQTGGEHIIELHLADEAQANEKELQHLPSVRSVTSPQTGHYSFSVEEPAKALPAVLNYVQQQSLPLEGLSTRHATLEDVFVTLTGRQLRDDA